MWSNVKDIVAVYTSLILKGNFVIAQLPFLNTCRSLVVSNGHVFAKQTPRFGIPSCAIPGKVISTSGGITLKVIRTQLNAIIA